MGRIIKKAHWVLMVLVVFTLAFRLLLAFQAQYFDNSAYENIRHIDSIKQSGLPLFEDNSVYGERSTIITPLFQYLMAGLTFIFPFNFTLKFFPNLFAVISIVFVFLIAKELTKKDESALFAAFVSAGVPIFIADTTNAVSSLSLSIPLLLASLFFFMNSKKRHYAIAFVSTFFALVLTTPMSIILVGILLVYMMLCKIESLKLMRYESELTIFSSFLTIWLYFVVYKKMIVLHGVHVLFHNTPDFIKAYVFGQFSVVSSIVLVGLVPVIAGIYIIYKHLFTEKHKYYDLMISFALVSAIMVGFGLLPLTSSLTLIGISLSILFADYYERLSTYLSRSKLSGLFRVIMVLLILLVLLTSFIPAYYTTAVKNYEVVSAQDVAAIVWLRYDAPDDAVIAVSPVEGSLVAYASGKSVVADMDFLGVNDAQTVNEDLRTLFRSPWKTDALEITDKYNITYVLITDTTREFYGIDDLEYADEKCFPTIYNDHERAKIYKVECMLRVEQ